jgi:hypothetical protein
MDGFFDCPSIARRFDRQDIFKAVLYGDGTIKMPDGRIFNPRQAYDAATLFKKDENAQTEAQAIYNKGGNVKVGEITIKTDGSAGDIKVAPTNTQKAVVTPKNTNKGEFRTKKNN